ncbi:MAG: STAS domain-containing protein [Kouleothrix sp.]|nr:STAS domain-containing protein [Kouleothrix sp.]
MEITVSSQQGRVPVTIFHVKGAVTETDGLVQRAEQEIAAGMRFLLVDLSEVPYMATAGLRALDTIYELLRSDTPDESPEALKAGIASGTYKSPHLKLFKPTKHVVEVLKMTGHDMFLDIYYTVQDAIASF